MINENIFSVETKAKLNSILSQVQKLSKVEQAVLLDKILAMLNATAVSKKDIRLMELSGLGSEIWRDTDIDKYVDDERQW